MIPIFTWEIQRKVKAQNLNANLKSDNQALEESTGIKSDFQLGGDVEKIGNFLAGKYLFGNNKPLKIKEATFPYIIK